MTVEHAPLTADELLHRRSANRRLRLMDLVEDVAVRAETGDSDRLRAAYAAQYQALVGVAPARRHDFREALRGLHHVSVEELAADLGDDAN